MKRILTVFTILLGLSALIGCTTTKEIPSDLTQAQLIQKGQNAFSAGDYKSAELYYKTVIQRFGNNTETYIEAKYELGHLYIKTKNYAKAQEAFDEIMEIYEYASYGDLPPAYKKLAQLGLDSIPADKKTNLSAKE